MHKLALTLMCAYPLATLALTSNAVAAEEGIEARTHNGTEVMKQEPEKAVPLTHGSYGWATWSFFRTTCSRFSRSIPTADAFSRPGRTIRVVWLAETQASSLQRAMR